jgi:choline-sulfatase
MPVAAVAAAILALATGCRSAPKATSGSAGAVGDAGDAGDAGDRRREISGELAFPGAPVVLVSIDTLRSDHLPAYGYRGVATPAIDALRRDALLFTHAYSQYPMTLPSHVSLLTGELPPEHGVRDNTGFPFDSARHPYLPRLLKGAGYDTGAVVSTTLLAGSTGLAGGFDLYDDRMAAAATLTEEAKRPGAESVRRAIDWVRARGARPFFLFLHLYDPHAPYAPPQPFAARYRDSPYDGEIAAADAAVGEVLDELRRLGIYDRAVVVLLSDHGEGLGEHGEQQHGTFLYRSTLQVPLLLKLPGQRLGGGSVAAAAQLIDVLPTVAGLTGVAVQAGLHGESLLRLQRTGETGRPIYAETLAPRLHYGWSELTSLIEGRLHLEEGPHPELFDLDTDPGESRDRLGDERRAYAAMRTALGGLYRPPAAPRPVDAETARRLAALGYVAAGGGATARGPLPDPRDRRADLAALEAAMLDLEQRRPAAAAARFESLLAANPRMLDVQLLLARTYRDLGRREAAAERCERMVAAADGAPRTALTAAAELLDLGFPQRAAPLVEAARGADPAAAAVLAVRVALARHDPDAALAELRRWPQGVLGGAAATSGAMVPLAPVALRRAVGMALADAGRSREALALLQPLAAGGDAATLDAIAVALTDSGRNQEAAAVAGQVLAAEPRNARAHQVLGTVALRSEQPAEARRQLQLAVEIDPRLAVAWNGLGVALYQGGGAAPALAAWKKAAEIDPDYCDALLNLGLVSASVGRRAEARQALQRFVAKAPPGRFGPDLVKARAVLRELGEAGG